MQSNISGNSKWVFYHQRGWAACIWDVWAYIYLFVAFQLEARLGIVGNEKSEFDTLAFHKPMDHGKIEHKTDDLVLRNL